MNEILETILKLYGKPGMRGVSHVFQDSFKSFDFHGNVSDFPPENL
jgi:hypothetical protein